MNTKVKKIALVLSLLVFVLPLIETQFGFFKFQSLKGAYTRKEKPAFSDSSWFDAKFQPAYEEYFNDTVGFRPLLIRIFNQLDYSLFNKLHAYDIVVGKNHTLQATTHYDAYLGKLEAPPPARSIDSLSHKLKLLQDTLATKNISLIFVFEPSRGSFEFENAPYWYDTTRKALSWYEQFLDNFTKSGVTYLDLNQYYLNVKGKTPYPLYTKYGVHWSTVSSVYAFDTLCKFIEKKQGVKLPSIVFNSPIEIIDPFKTDIDLTPSLNLLSPFKVDEKFLAPSYSVKSDSNTSKVNAMFITDSYFWNIAALGLPDQLFSHWSFWYYFTTVYEKNINQPSYGASKDIGLEIEKYNSIIIMSTFTTLHNPGWGFIDKAYEFYFGERKKKLQDIIKQMTDSPQWYNEIKAKAAASKISVEDQLKLDAEYVYSLRNK